MGFFSSSPASVSSSLIPLTKEQKLAQGNMVNWMNNGTGIAPEQIAPMTDAEKQSQSMLNSYINNNTTNPTYTNAVNELNKTMQGGYDPTTSPLYNGYKQQQEIARQKGLDQISLNGQKGGFASALPTGRLAADYNAQIDAQNMQQLGTLFNQERDRQMQAVNSSLPFIQYGDNQPLQKIAAAQQYGSLPRTLEQAQNAANYQQQLNDFNTQQANASAIYNKDRYNQWMTGAKPSDFSAIFNGASKGAQAGSAAGPWGTIIGGIGGGVLGGIGNN